MAISGRVMRGSEDWLRGWPRRTDSCLRPVLAPRKDELGVKVGQERIPPEETKQHLSFRDHQPNLPKAYPADQQSTQQLMPRGTDSYRTGGQAYEANPWPTHQTQGHFWHHPASAASSSRHNIDDSHGGSKGIGEGMAKRGVTTDRPALPYKNKVSWWFVKRLALDCETKALCTPEKALFNFRANRALRLKTKSPPSPTRGRKGVLPQTGPLCHTKTRFRDGSWNVWHLTVKLQIAWTGLFAQVTWKFWRAGKGMNLWKEWNLDAMLCAHFACTSCYQPIYWSETFMRPHLHRSNRFQTKRWRPMILGAIIFDTFCTRDGMLEELVAEAYLDHQ